MKKLEIKDNNQKNTKMKIATFNIQNLFHRDKSLIKPPAGKCVLNWINEMNFLMRKILKSGGDLERMKELSFLLGFENCNPVPYAVMRKRGGELFLKGSGGSLENKASSISEWNGWVPVQTVPLNPVATENKAKVIAEGNSDILLLQETEDRNSLKEFNLEFLPKYNMVPYSEQLVLQGNDPKGLELGLLTKNGFTVLGIKTFMDDRNDKNDLLFDKNVLQYEITTPSGNIFWLIAVHFIDTAKDKETTEGIRFQQAYRVAELYQEMRREGKLNVLVAGTFNAVSYCHSLSPLLQETDLKDVAKHSGFNVDLDTGKDSNYYRLGAYRMGINIKQKDYLLLSPEMFKRVKSAGLNRKAVWPDKPGKWQVYNSLQNRDQAASYHPMVWAEIDL